MSIDSKNFGDYSVKSVKSFVGHDGYGFNATLYRKGKKIAFCIDMANGGEVEIDWEVKGEMKILDDHLKTLEPVKFNGMTLTIDEGWFVTDLVTKWEKDRDLRKMRRQCLTKTLFKTKEHKKGRYSAYNAVFSPELKAFIVKKYGKDVEIFNEVIDNGGTPSVLA